VHFRHTLRFLDAAGAAAAGVDLVLLPGERHALRRREALVFREQRVIGFLAKHLGLAMPPDDPATDDQAAW
jgi:dipeptidyl aminopeptidase/acylaminoacyl peptidase